MLKPTIRQKRINGSDKRGQAAIISSGNCTIRRMLKVRLLKTEAMEILLYGGVTRALGQGHVPDHRSAHENLPLGVNGFQRRQRTDRFISIAKALKEEQTESVETTT